MFNRNMRLSVSDYPQSLPPSDTGGPKFSPVTTGRICGLSPPNKASTPKLKCEKREISVVLSIRVLFCPVIYRQSSTCWCYLE